MRGKPFLRCVIRQGMKAAKPASVRQTWRRHRGWRERAHFATCAEGRRAELAESMEHSPVPKERVPGSEDAGKIMVPVTAH